MALSRKVRALSLALALACPITGCATTEPTGASYALRADRVSADAPGADLAAEPFELEPASFEATHGLDRTRHGGAAVGLIVAAVVVFPFVVLVDLITLPISAPCHRGFYCTRAVVHHCCR
jgi:hypothetical protein